MQAAASSGRKMLVDRITKQVLWIEGPADHYAPTGRYPNSEIINIHEETTLRGPKLGEKFNG
jgi:hypothetical protein